jgi:hypothetical protein
VINVEFSGNSQDIVVGGAPCTVVGCHSTSQNFVNAQSQTHIIAGTDGYFANVPTSLTQGSLVIAHSNSDKGMIGGNQFSFLEIYDSTFGATDPLNATAAGGGARQGALEWHLPTSAFASLTTHKYQGMEADVTDATVNSFGANVTAGSGSNFVRVRWNGGNWTGA